MTANPHPTPGAGPAGARSRIRTRRAGALALALLSIACEARPQAAPDQLRVAADRVLPRLQELAGLEQLGPIALDVRDRAQLRAFVEQRLAEEYPPERMAGVQATYEALGLLPEGSDLEALLLDLYSEQIVGFYDPARDTLYLVDDVPEEQLETVLIHELVHALQDQHADLEALVDPALGADRQAAAQAAIEGHATLVMVGYAVDALGADPSALALLPDIALQLGPALQATSFPVLSRAPRIIKDALLFPYFGGAGFAQQLWRRAAAGELDTGSEFPAPLGPLLPASTEQVRHPGERFFGQRDAPTEVRFDGPRGADWPVLYENTFGELELSIMLSEWLGEAAASLAAGWDGDRFAALRTPGGGVALDVALVWDDSAGADAFADAYRRAAAGRPGRAVAVTRGRLEGRELVRIADVPAGEEPTEIPPRSVRFETETDG